MKLWRNKITGITVWVESELRGDWEPVEAEKPAEKPAEPKKTTAKKVGKK